MIENVHPEPPGLLGVSVQYRSSVKASRIVMGELFWTGRIILDGAWPHRLYWIGFIRSFIYTYESFHFRGQLYRIVFTDLFFLILLELPWSSGVSPGWRLASIRFGGRTSLPRILGRCAHRFQVLRIPSSGCCGKDRGLDVVSFCWAFLLSLAPEVDCRKSYRTILSRDPLRLRSVDKWSLWIWIP